MEGKGNTGTEGGRQDIPLLTFISTFAELAYPLVALSVVNINANETVNS